MTIAVNDYLWLELINEEHSLPIFNLVDQNRSHLREWLPFVDKMQTVDFANNFVKGTMQRNADGHEFAFVIVEQGVVIGRIGVYKIDNQNKIGEIGYWLSAKAQGKGYVVRATQAIINFCFNDLRLNRIEIKCAIQNFKSKSVPEKLNFKLEGISRQSELLYDRFVDLYVYALLKSDL